jgi:hypothetical protein
LDPSLKELGMRALDADGVEKVTSERETERRYDRFTRSLGRKDELNKDDYRKLAYWLFQEPQFRPQRRQALLTGQITMGDGRVIRRKDHVDMRRNAEDNEAA